MGKKIGIEVSIAVSEAVRAADVDLIAAYPITPQTHIVEHLSELVADGKLDAEFVPVESEHSAMSLCIGSSAAGARTYTATSSQGLALMHEIVWIAPALRMPIVMTLVNRSMSGPISIWNDHSDVMSERDCCWIQTFAENGQEAFDLTLHAFKVAEHPDVLLPVMVNLDGFTLSHVIEPIELMTQAEAGKYLKPYEPTMRLDTKQPVTMGGVGIPAVYTEAKKQYETAITASKKVILDAWKEFGEVYGRKYKPIETYKTKGAEIVLMTMGSISETAMTAIDLMRDKGISVGLMRFRLWRPFPLQEFRRAVKDISVLAVVDRAISYGSQGGPVFMEVRSALYDQEVRPQVFGFVTGLGGRDVTVDMFEDIVSKASKYAEKGKGPVYEMIGVREK
ncbi:MAG: pyruvate ferredoxin oxidoreductase [Deltaproteobacteria bacterium]|jgi:pyruvate ferredoxin oxidoreductase alpha subunit|nr:pyruvate ferredoxin oxidoreductase [Deltaproteobacteria bacterium]